MLDLESGHNFLESTSLFLLAVPGETHPAIAADPRNSATNGVPHLSTATAHDTQQSFHCIVGLLTWS